MIKKFSTASLLIFIISSGQIFAQQKTILPGTKSPYPKPPAHYTDPPAGFKPVFINYVGRHGSRFLTKPEGDVIIFGLLNKADSVHQLTETGTRIKKMVGLFLGIEKGNYGNITLQGKQEQYYIGKRMRSSYSNVFRGDRIEVLVTKKKRTQQSADAFLKAFTGYSGEISFSNDTALEENILRFYDVSPSYDLFKQSAGVQSQLDSLAQDKRSLLIDSAVCFRIFKHSLAQEILTRGIAINTRSNTIKVRGSSLVDYLFDLYGARFSMSTDIEKHGYSQKDIDFSIAFSSDELRWLQFRDGADDFIKKGPGTDPAGIQIKIAAPLLANFINTTDVYIQNPAEDVSAILRFTHAEAISPFATLLGIEKASKPSSSVFNYQKCWNASQIIPMSSNIQWVLYSDGYHYLVKVLLNEKETTLPIPTSTFPYYKWNEVRKYYTSVLQQMHLNLDGDMHRYLEELR